MLVLIETYPYLMWSLALAALLAIAMTLCPIEHRRITLLNGALALPFALTACVGAPLYWSPQKMGFLRFGPEDVIYSFAAAGCAWLLAVWPLNERIAINIRPDRLAWRYILIVAAGTLCGLGGLQLRIKPMSGFLLTLVLLGTVLLWLRPRLWVLAAAGSAGFAAFHFACLRMAFFVTPSFAHSWNEANLWGPRLFGIPMDEIAWAVVFGAVWPMFAAFVLDAQLVSPATPRHSRATAAVRGSYLPEEISGRLMRIQCLYGIFTSRVPSGNDATQRTQDQAHAGQQAGALYANRRLQKAAEWSHTRQPLQGAIAQHSAEYSSAKSKQQAFEQD